MDARSISILQIPKRKHNAVNNHGGNGRRWEIAKAITLVANTNDGIGLHDNVTAVVENNACLHNVEAGIWFGDNATGSARNRET